MQRDRRKLLLPRRGPNATVRGSASKTSTTTTCTVAQADFVVPPQPGDLLLAFATTATDDGTLGSSGFAASGWTQLLGGGGGGSPTGAMTVFTRYAGPADGSYVFDTGGASQANVVQVIAVRDGSPVDAVDAAALSSGTTQGTVAPVLHASRPGCLSIFAASAAWPTVGSATWAPPGGVNAHVELHDASIDQTTFTVSGAVAHRAAILAGSTGARSYFSSRATPSWTSAAAVLVRGL